MLIYLKNNGAKFHPDQIWNDGALDFLEEVAPTRRRTARKTWTLNVKLLYVSIIAITVSRMTSHCAGTVQTREKSESEIRKWEEMWFKPRAEDGEREGGSAVTCDGRLFHRRAAATGNAHLSPTVDRRVRRESRDVDEAERSRRLAWVSAGWRSSSRRYVGARPCWHFVRQNSDPSLK